MATMQQLIRTPITDMFGVKHPVILAGMNVAAGARLASAVTNAGGLGVIGGVNYTPAQLQAVIDELKDGLHDKSAPFGVDLLLPKVGEGARATNYDYTHGALDALIDIVIASGAKLFVSAVGVPPARTVERLHASGIYVMNMIGAVKHIKPALAAGVDIICAQGGEGGGHTGATPTSILIPKAVDACRNHTSPLTGVQVPVVAAGGIFDSRGLAMSLSLGAEAVWVGTRFVASEEASAPPRHKKGIVAAGYDDTYRTLIYTGRPLRVIKNAYASDWEDNRPREIVELCKSGKLPYEDDMEKREKEGRPLQGRAHIEAIPLLAGCAVGAIDNILPAKVIVEEMVVGAANIVKRNASLVVGGEAQAKL
uniref:Nitronate monooxygenase domain-containing protein n=1 Tax=Pycnococcus provasolii TaxID=41880 RepID=A0A7S2AH76_9CHLO|mmetsp:Transcript_10776/g.24323  ORF Transcript_10776/g.24323 Transcript_10776/m.24323 type:complete len:366 (+) Transcript_10776:46-1143(+)